MIDRHLAPSIPVNRTDCCCDGSDICDPLPYVTDFSDYEFLREPFEGWILNGYCIILVENTSGAELLQLLNADIWPERVRGYEEMNLVWPSTLDHFIGAADLPGQWTLVLQTAAGYMGTSEYVMGPVAARGHDIVSIYGAEGAGRVAWWEDGVLIASLDSSDLDYDGAWSGANPRRFEQVWNAVVPVDLNDRPDRGWVYPQALFAAAETITGTRLSEDVLSSSDLTLGIVRAWTPPEAGEYSGRLREAGWDARAM